MGYPSAASIQHAGLVAALQLAALSPDTVRVIGSRALNRYLPPAFYFAPSDCDLVLACPADDVEKTFQALFYAFQHQFTAVLRASSGLPLHIPHFSSFFVFLAGFPSYHISIGAHHILDISFIPPSPSTERLAERFPPQRCKVIHNKDSSAFYVMVASREELLHRISSTILSRATLDGIVPPDSRTNAWRIVKDQRRLERIRHCAKQGLLFTQPAPWVLTPDPLPNNPSMFSSTDGPCMPNLPETFPLASSIATFASSLMASMDLHETTCLTTLAAHATRLDVLETKAIALQSSQAEAVRSAAAKTNADGRAALLLFAQASKKHMTNFKRLAFKAVQESEHRASLLVSYYRAAFETCRDKWHEVDRQSRDLFRRAAESMKTARLELLRSYAEHSKTRKITLLSLDPLQECLRQMSKQCITNAAMDDFRPEFMEVGRAVCAAGIAPFCYFPVVTGGLPFESLSRIRTPNAVTRAFSYNLLAAFMVTMEMIGATRSVARGNMTRTPTVVRLDSSDSGKTLGRLAEAIADRKLPPDRYAMMYMTADGNVGLTECELESKSDSDTDSDSGPTSITAAETSVKMPVVVDHEVFDTDEIEVSQRSVYDATTHPLHQSHLLKLPLDAHEMRGVLAMFDSFITVLATPFLARISAMSRYTEVLDQGCQTAINQVERRKMDMTSVSAVIKDLKSHEDMFSNYATVGLLGSSPFPSVAKPVSKRRRRRKR